MESGDRHVVTLLQDLFMQAIILGLVGLVITITCDCNMGNFKL